MTVSVSSLESVPSALCRGHVGDRAAVQVGLRDRVGGGAGDRLARVEEAVVRPARAGDRRLVVGDRDRAGELHVAGVGDEVAVGDRLADRRVGRRRRRLDQRQRLRLDRGDRLGVLVRVGAVRGCLGHVGDRAAVQVGLRDRVGRGAGDDLARIEEAVAVADRVSAGQVTVALSSATVTGPARRTLPVLVTR